MPLSEVTELEVPTSNLDESLSLFSSIRGEPNECSG
jgi:hypothetical protein